MDLAWILIIAKTEVVVVVGVSAILLIGLAILLSLWFLVLRCNRCL